MYLRNLFIIFIALFLLSTIYAQVSQGQELRISEIGYFLCNKDHPRCKETEQNNYKYHQFGMLHVGQYAGVSELLKDGPPLIQHQTWLSELITERPGTNSVASWSDAMSVVDGGRVWGGFISARSEFKLKEGADSQLIGLEIDVLNAGKAGVYPNASKVGLQIVGFGAANSNAIEVLNQSPTSGKWNNIINIEPGSVDKLGTIIGAGPQNAHIGINFFGSSFSDSAIILSPESKITFRSPGSSDGAIYRDVYNNGFIVIQSGPAGFRITNTENNKNLLIVTPNGDIITPFGNLSEIVKRQNDLEHRLEAIEKR